MTERHVDAVTIRNARLMISCGLDFDHAAQQRVRSCLPGMDAELRLGDIALKTGMGWRAHRAAVALIQSRCLSAPAGQPLTLVTPLNNNLR